MDSGGYDHGRSSRLYPEVTEEELALGLQQSLWVENLPPQDGIADRIFQPYPHFPPDYRYTHLLPLVLPWVLFLEIQFFLVSHRESIDSSFENLLIIVELWVFLFSFLSDSKLKPEWASCLSASK